MRRRRHPHHVRATVRTAALVAAVGLVLSVNTPAQTAERLPSEMSNHGGTTSTRARRARTVRVPAGAYLPLYAAPASPGARKVDRTSARRRVAVASFEIDVYPVTNGEFLEFVRAHPEWRRSRVPRLFADASYLRHWRGDLELGDQAPADSPVVYVSWFAARAYLKTTGKALPTVDQWEYAAAASETRRDASRDPAFIERLRIWYGTPTPPRLPPVDQGIPNVYGIRGLHGLIWEWTLDFNSALVTGESREDSALDRTRYCGSGAAGASDFDDYAAFMRYAFRSSLEARYTVGTLGFRGVRQSGVRQKEERQP